MDHNGIRSVSSRHRSGGVPALASTEEKAGRAEASQLMADLHSSLIGPRQKWEMKTRKQVKAREDRLEAKVQKLVRAACVERDGPCLVLTRIGIYGECRGVSEWAHLSGHRRSQTLGMPATYRHNTAWTAMLCTRHHSLEEHDKFHVIYRTASYADGLVAWERVA
jgi:hypothetical protein